MQAKISTEGDVVVVHLSGRLDVETALPFRQACLEHLTDRRVVFNFRHLSFVGSSGILPFLETMQDFARTNRRGFNFCAVGSEFRKVLSATSLSAVEIFENERLAIISLGSQDTARVSMVSATESAPPRMPPPKMRVVTEGVNPIFVDSLSEGSSVVGSDVDADADAETEAHAEDAAEEREFDQNASETPV